MKKRFLIPVMLLISAPFFSQGVYNNGGKIVIGSGVTIFVDGTGGNYLNETNVSDGSMDLSGTLVLAGNLTNNVAAADVFSSAAVNSEVRFAGTALQTVGGTTTSLFAFPSITINNASGVTFLKNAMVNGIMTFTNGLVDIGNNNFTFGLLSSVSGSPSAASMIVATGSGQVIKDWSSIGSFSFPIGDNTVTAEYSPVFLNLTAGTFAPGAFVGTNLVNDKFNDPAITGSYLNRYWNLSQTGITGLTCDVLFQYTAADVVGTESNISTLRVVPSPFSVFDAANTTLHQLSAGGLTAFDTFTGGLGLKTLNLKLFLQGNYIGGGVMSPAQGTSGNQFPGTVADQISVELHDPALYSNNLYTINNVDLSTSGSAIISIPSSYSGLYNITVNHRNSIGVVSSSPVSFASPSISYDFSTFQTQAFGSNMINLGGGIFGLYGGDSNADGIVDGNDLINVENSATLFTMGYVLTDLNGDGIVDALDLIVAENNAFNFIFFLNP